MEHTHHKVTGDLGFGSDRSITPARYDAFLKLFRAAPPGKLFCLHGDSRIFRLSLYAAASALLRGIPIALVDGTNRFDAYYLAEFARRVTSQRLLRRRVTPEQILERIFIARAFTCYQMEATLTERLPQFVKRIGAPVAMVFGLLDTFYDEQAPLFEVKASLERIIAGLQQMKNSGISVLLASVEVKLESKERNGLLPRVDAAMDQVFYVEEMARDQQRIQQHLLRSSLPA
jgi:hypothetical protein